MTADATSDLDPTVQTSRTKETVAPTDPERRGRHHPGRHPARPRPVGRRGRRRVPLRPTARHRKNSGSRSRCALDTVWPLEDPPPVDQLWAWAVGPEYGDRRELVVLPTVDAAVAAVQAFRDALADCEREDHKVWTEHACRHRARLGDLQRSRTPTASASGPTRSRGSATPSSTRSGTARARSATRCEPCSAVPSSPGPSPPASASTSRAGCGGSSETPAPALHDPGRFPLAAGWPRATGEPGYQGLTGPNRTLPPLGTAPCDVPADDPEHADRLRAEWADIEDHRSRQLHALLDRAVAASEALSPATRRANYAVLRRGRSRRSLQGTTYGTEADGVRRRRSWSVAATETYDVLWPDRHLGAADTTHSGGAGSRPGHRRPQRRWFRPPGVDSSGT